MHWHACRHLAKIETRSTKKVRLVCPHLLIWIRVIVESNPTVICDFREIFIIELLQADVVGWPGNRRDSIFTACHDEAHSALQYACFISDSQEGAFSLTYAQILCSVSGETYVNWQGLSLIMYWHRQTHKAMSSVCSLLTVHSELWKVSVVQSDPGNISRTKMKCQHWHYLSYICMSCGCI